MNFGLEWSVFGLHVQGQLSVARDDGKQGVEVMSYAARQIPHRIHLLGRQKLGFQP